MYLVNKLPALYTLGKVCDFWGPWGDRNYMAACRLLWNQDTTEYVVSSAECCEETIHSTEHIAPRMVQPVEGYYLDEIAVEFGESEIYRAEICLTY